MTDSWNIEKLDLTVIRRIDAECSRFENQLQTQSEPQIESYLASFTGNERRALLHELLMLEIDYKSRVGKPAQREDYLIRFLQDADLIEYVFQQAAPGSADLAVEPTVDLGSGNHSKSSQKTPFLRLRENQATHRYVDRRKHAHGGMGEVFTAADSFVGRRVALKRLRPGRRGSQERFVAEAQITGQLEHPGIVPLYDMGLDADGQPYYVMKFVEGKTLRHAIVEYHAIQDDQARHLRTVQLLQIFVSLCQTVAFAHSKGIIHCDLKPDNIMLGSFGEALVLDWGVARVLHAEAVPGLVGSVSISTSGTSALTQDASVVGSPPYMSPEAALGKIDEVAEQSDVYLLGSTLFEILTGAAPRKGTSVLEVVQMARSTDPPPPRALVKSIPRELDAICQKAMARAPSDRYRSALHFAEDVQRFLANEPVHAFPEPLLTRAWRLLKRKRKQFAMAGLATFAIACLILAAIQLQRAQALRERERARNEIAEFRAMADEVSYYAANNDSIDEKIPYYNPTRATELSKRAMSIAEKWGPQLEGMPLVEERMELQRQLRELARCAGSPTELESVPASHLQGDRKPEDAQSHFVQGEAIRTSASRRRLMARWDGESDPAQVHSLLKQALHEYDAALSIEPAHYWSHYQRARCFLALGKTNEAVEALGACIALKDNVPWAFNGRGIALALRGDYADALRDIDHAERLDPSNPVARLNRGVVCRLMGPSHYQQAIDEFTRVLDDRQSEPLVEAAFARGQIHLLQRDFQRALQDFDWVAREQPEFSPVFELRAQVQLLQGDIEAGLQDLNRLFGLAENMPDDQADGKRLWHRGRFLRHLASQPGDRQGIIAEMSEKDLRQAVARGEDGVDVQRELAFALRLTGRPAEALALYDATIERFPNHVPLRIERGWVLVQELGNATQAKSDFEAALARQPENAEAHAGAGYCAACQKKPDEARRFAASSLLYGAGDYLNIHNVACIYSRLFREFRDEQAHDDDSAVRMIQRELELWKRGGGTAPDAEVLVRQESEFRVLGL